MEIDVACFRLKRKNACRSNLMIWLFNVKTNAGELYYLRLLLLHCQGLDATSFDSLKREQVDGLATHQQFARDLGLLHDDTETKAMLTEGVNFLTSTSKLCELMAETLVWLDSSDPVSVWNHFLVMLATHHASTAPIGIWMMVESNLQSYSVSLVEFGIPQPPTEQPIVMEDRAAREYAAELRSATQRCEEKRLHDSYLLNESQEEIYSPVCELIDGTSSGDAPNVVFVDGPAGTGSL